MLAKILLCFTFFMKLQNISKSLLNATQEPSPKIAFEKIAQISVVNEIKLSVYS